MSKSELERWKTNIALRTGKPDTVRFATLGKDVRTEDQGRHLTYYGYARLSGYCILSYEKQKYFALYQGFKEKWRSRGVSGGDPIRETLTDANGSYEFVVDVPRNYHSASILSSLDFSHSVVSIALTISLFLKTVPK